jgi:hypothetical protein
MADHTELADRPAHRDEEIKITPEMIMAGVSVFNNSSTDYEFEEDIVREIYLSMSRSKKQLGR